MSPTTLLTPDDLLTMPDGEHYEYINGHAVEKHMGAKSDKLSLRLGGWLDQFVLLHGLGHVFGSSAGYRCFPRKVRKPDASFVRAGRLPNEEVPDGDISLTPDLAVEVVSPNDLYEEVEEKLNDYRLAGVKLLWVVSPQSRTVLIRRLDGSANLLPETGELSGEDVVPGFTCKIADLFV